MVVIRKYITPVARWRPESKWKEKERRTYVVDARAQKLNWVAEQHELTT
jgi:hypothetical protein